MVRTYTAKVQQGAVTVRDPSLPENATVAVTIDAGVDELSDEVIAALDEAALELDRDEWITGEECIRRLREGGPVYRPRDPRSAEADRSRRRVVAGKPGRRSKDGRRRAR